MTVLSEEESEEIESLKRTYPDLESLLEVQRIPFRKEKAREIMIEPRALKLLSVLFAIFLSLSIIFLLIRWIEHPLIARSGILKEVSKKTFLLYFLPLFAMITPVLSLAFSNILLRTDWNKIMKSEESSYRNLAFSLSRENSALTEKWRLKELTWSLKKNKPRDLIPWKLFSPFILLAVMLFVFYFLWPDILIRPQANALLFGKPEKTLFDQTVRFLEPKIEFMLKSFLDSLFRRIDLLLGW